MAYRDFKDLNRRTFAEKVLHDKAFNIAKHPDYDKKISGSGIKKEYFKQRVS